MVKSEKFKVLVFLVWYILFMVFLGFIVFGNSLRSSETKTPVEVVKPSALENNTPKSFEANDQGVTELSNSQTQDLYFDDGDHTGHDHVHEHHSHASGVSRVILLAENTTDFYFFTGGSSILNVEFEVEFTDGTFNEHEHIHPVDGSEDLTHSTLYSYSKPVWAVHILGEAPSDLDVKEYSFESLIEVQKVSSASVDDAPETVYTNQLFQNLGLDIITREEWGAPVYSGWVPGIAKVNQFVVHHTAWNVDADPADSVRRIYFYHRDICSSNVGRYPASCTRENTWYDIGYNYLIDPAGNVYEGREGGNGTIGAHSPPNSGKIGIALMGNFQYSPPSAAAIESLEKLIGVLSGLNDIEPVFEQTVFGHRHYQNTACPGEKTYELLLSISANAKTTYDGIIWFDELNTQIDEILFDQMYDFLGYGKLTIDASSISDPSIRDKLIAGRSMEASSYQNKLTLTIPISSMEAYMRELLLLEPDIIMKPDYNSN